ncbi:MAG: sulfatase [Myxococcota bacterium]|nr:sulfatase [Myxococcota bacterium]
MKPQQAVLLAGLVLGLGLVAYGVFMMGSGAGQGAGRGATPVAAPTTGPRQGAGATAGATPPARGPVAPGSGTFTNPAPESNQSASAEALCPGCDVVVITLCSMRRDHLGAYGGPTDLTPNLDALAAESVRFDNAWSASNFTLAGLTALLTGRFGSSTGVTGWDKGLVSDVPTLPEILGFYGYRTGAFTIDAPSGFRPDYGLDRGFQTMTIIPPPRDTPDGRLRQGEPGPGGQSAEPAAAWVSAQDGSGPIFVMFHSRTAHFPFVIDANATDPPGVTQAVYNAGNDRVDTDRAMPGTAGGTAQKGVVAIGKDPLQELTMAQGEAGIQVWKDEYAKSVGRTDVDVGVLLDAVKDRGNWDRTIVVVAADHGESLGDQGEILHGDAYFDSVTHIPLMVRIPGLPAGSTNGLVGHVDILPTLLALVGAMEPADIDGVSMVPLATGTSDEIRKMTLIEGGVTLQQGPTPRGAVIAPPWALLRQDRGCGGSAAPRKPGEPAECLFNLEEDPGQTRNVILQHPDVRERLVGSWDAFRAARATAGQRLQLDPEMVEELQRTGYDFRGEADR